MTPETITIPIARYERLCERDDFLARLEDAGVDNWEGYSNAFQDDEDAS